MVARAENEGQGMNMAKKAKKQDKKKSTRKDASQTALSIVEQVTGSKLVRK